MISRLEGELIEVDGGRASVRCGHLTYDLLVPAADQAELAGRLNETMNFHTLHYLEGQGQGSSFVPRLIGFQTEADRRFFELFTTVKGMGNRKALRALALPFSTIAGAIATKDIIMLKSLPEVGPRTAETIVAELHGKVDQAVELKPADGMPAGAPLHSADEGLLRDAVAVLHQLGEPAHQARQLVERALAADPTIDTPDGLVAAAFRLKEMV
jgi:Holliday junction DNA helicase RuvA